MKMIKFFLILTTVILMMSCGSHYRMVTTLDRNGNAHREVYARGDSAFMAGNMTKNPFLFDISNWEVTRMDSAIKYNFFGNEKSLNVRVAQTATSIDQFSKNIHYETNNQSLVAPEESLTKQFRWFYTYHTFKGIYKQFKYDAPVPISNYLSKEEQQLWGQGDFSSYGALNGAEMNDLLGEIEDKSMEWYSRNCFEISFVEIQKISQEYNNLNSDKEHIYKKIQEKSQHVDIDPRRVCQVLDEYYGTSYFSELFTVNEMALNTEFEKQTAVMSQVGNVISYELVVPGTIISTNSSTVDQNTIIWKVDGMRLLFDDYTLTAAYRIANIWAFVLAGLILTIAVVSIVLLLKRRRRR